MKEAPGETPPSAENKNSRGKIGEGEDVEKHGRVDGTIYGPNWADIIK